jgi:hypothetical protein
MCILLLSSGTIYPNPGPINSKFSSAHLNIRSLTDCRGKFHKR